MPPCPEGLSPISVEQTMAQADLLAGGKVAVQGPLRAGDGHCTTLLCLKGCCNECGSMLVLATEEALHDKDFERQQRTMLRIHGENLFCSGDDSLVCCRVEATGQDVVAQGTLKHSGTVYLLEGATICTPPPRP